MGSKDEAVKYVRRFNFLGKQPTSTNGSCDPILGWNISSKTDFTHCEVLTDKVERGETLKKVWRLSNISSRSHLEALASSGGCTFGFGEGVDKIQLRFFLKQEVKLSAFEKDWFRKHFSLFCESPSGGEGKELAFALKVDKLSGNLQFKQTVVTERAVILNREKDPQGTLVQSIFLPYLKSQIQNNGQLCNTKYLFGSVNELNFGFSVTQLHCSGKYLNDKPKGFYPKLESFESD